MNVLGKLQELGYNPVPASNYDLINTWKQWYAGSVDKFHTYTVWNGTNRVDCHRYSVGMGKKVSEDWADLLLNEKVALTLSGEREQEFVDEVLRRNQFRVKGNEMQEKKAALGTVAYVFRATGATVNANGAIGGAADIKMDYCTAPAIVPLSWDNGVIRECAFVSSRNHAGERYTYLQIHKLNGNVYDIENRLYNESSEEVPLSTIPNMSGVPNVIHTNSDVAQFVIDKLNIANPVDDNPMGISVFASAIDQLKGVDIAYDSYVNEFVLGKKRIMVKPEATKDLNGRPVFDPNDTVYYVLPEDSENGILVEQVDMTLRTQEHNAGMQDMLNVLGSKCGFGENHYKYDRGSVSTATQIVSENSSLFRTLKKHELILRDVLVNICRVILRMGNIYMNAGLDEEVDITVDFDDSIIEDTETKLQSMKADVDSGYLRPEIYLAKKYGVTEEQALEMMPGMEDLTTEAQFEVE